MGDKITTYMTAVFALKPPTKTKAAVLDNRLRHYHLLFDRLLKNARANLDDFAGQTTNQIKTTLSKRIKADASFTKILKRDHISSAMKDGLVKDLAYTLSSYFTLKEEYDDQMKLNKIPPEKKEKLSPPGTPTIPPLIVSAENWEARLWDLALAVELEDETEARNRLLYEAKAGKHRPILFTRRRLHDGFLLLKHKEKDRFYVFLNLYGAKSHYAKKRKDKGRKVDLSHYQSIIADEKIAQSTDIGLVFPINFGKDYQYDQFLRWCVENTTGEIDPLEITPKTAKLVKRKLDKKPDRKLDKRKSDKTADRKWVKRKLEKRADRFEIHITFEIKREEKEPLTRLGVDRGIHNLASLCVINNDGKVIAEENFDGSHLKYIQKKQEERQKDIQKRGKKYRSTTRRSEANKAIHTTVKHIVALAEKHHAQVVLEDLKNLTRRNFGRGRSNFNLLLNRSQYAKLGGILKYKLTRAGLPPPVSEWAAYTSITCPQCGNDNSANRDRNDPKNRFICTHCAYQHDADLNAARVIALRNLWLFKLPKNKKHVKYKELENTKHSFSSFLKRLAK